MGCFPAATIRGVVLVTVAGFLATACSAPVPTSTDEMKAAPIGDHAAAPPPMHGGIAAVRSHVAQNALKNRDYATAERLFREAHEASPEAAAPLIGLGEALYALGRYVDAVSTFRAALNRDGDAPEAREGLAKSLITAGIYGEARDILEAAVKTRPSAALLNKLGVARDLSGDGDAAQEAYRAALTIEPENRSARNNLALSLAISGRHQDAVAEMERVAASAGNDDRYRGNLVFVYGLAGDYAAVQRVSGRSEDGEGQLQARFDQLRALAASGDRATVLAMIADSEVSGSGHETTSGPKSMPSDTILNSNEESTSLEADPKPDRDTADTERAAAAPELPQATREPSTQMITGAPQSAALAGSPTPVEEAAEAPPAPEADPQLAALPPDRAAPAPSDHPAAAAVNAQGPVTSSDSWRVQVGAYRTLAHVARGRAILMATAGDLLPSLEAVVLSKNEEDKAIAYRLRTPAVSDKAAATALCSALQARQVACLAVRQSGATQVAALDPTAPVTTAHPVAEEPRVAQAGVDPGRGWRVQLAAYRTLAHTRRGHEILMKKVGDLLPALEALVRTDTGEKQSGGVPFRLRTPEFLDKAAATTLCNTLQERGVTCLVIQQAAELWAPPAG